MYLGSFIDLNDFLDGEYFWLDLMTGVRGTIG